VPFFIRLLGIDQKILAARRESEHFEARLFSFGEFLLDIC
jgi:hypothetical protein